MSSDPASTEVIVRPLRPGDRSAWERLWSGYLQFYQAVLPADVTAATWQRLIEPDHPTYGGLIAERDGVIVGMANYIIHDHTWSITPRCYLNDLFVEPAVRGGGIGKAMIAELQALAEENGWTKVHWLTAENNEAARRLYDQFAPATGLIQYAIEPKGRP